MQLHCLKPNKKKIIYSILIALIWFSILLVLDYSTMCSCPMIDGNCADYEYLVPFLRGSCYCSCMSLLSVIIFYFEALIFPFLVTYFIMSVREKNKDKMLK